MRKTSWIASVLVTISLAACGGGKLSKDQCQQLVDHGIELMIKKQGADIPPDILKQAKEAAKAQLDEALDKCVKEGTKGEFDCGMKASSMEDFMKCGD